MSAVPPGFRPKGAGTGVGSMPHAAAQACVDAAVSACPELPFWPTRPLAVASEEMIRQWSLGLPGVGMLPSPEDEGGARPAWVGRDRAPGRPGLPAEAAGTLEPFLLALRPRPPGWLKLQATGPVTLALALEVGGSGGSGGLASEARTQAPGSQAEPSVAPWVDTGSGGLASEARAGAPGSQAEPSVSPPVSQALAVPSARGPLVVGYAARIRSLITRVREALPGWRVMLVLDEPSLGHPLVVARPRLALELWRSLGSTGAEVTGLHCCAPPPWGLVLDLDPQLVSFDAISDGDTATDDPAFRRLVEGGAAVAWGLVPVSGGTDETLDPDAVAERLLDLVEWTAGDYLPEVLARSLVTPTCGLASLDEAEAARRLALAATVGSRAWSLAGLP